MDGTEEVAEEQKRSSTFQVQHSAGSSSEGGGGAEERYSSRRPSNFEIDYGEEKSNSFTMVNPMHGGGVRIFSPEVSFDLDVGLEDGEAAEEEEGSSREQEPQEREFAVGLAHNIASTVDGEGESEGKRPGLQRLSTEKRKRGGGLRRWFGRT